MTGKRTLLSLKQLQPFLVSGGKISLTQLHPPQKKTVEISLLYVQELPVFAELTVEDAAVAVHVSTYDGQPKVAATICSLATTVLHGIAAGQLFNAATSRHVRVAAIPFSGVIHRVDHLWTKLPHGLTRPVRLLPYLSLPCPDILCCLSQAVESQRQLRMLRVHLRSVPRMR